MNEYSEIQTPQERSPRERITTQYPNIRFEAGYHTNRPITDNVNVWNPEVAKRLSEYQPELVAIDGCAPSRHGHIIPDFILKSLPGLPSQISPSKSEIFVVRGDAVEYLEPAMDAATYYRLPVDLQEHCMDLFKDLQNFEQSNKVLDTLARGGENLGLWGLGTLLLRASYLTTGKSESTRREFLKMVAGAGAGLALLTAPIARLAASEGTATSETEQARESFQKIATLLRPIFREGHWWLDGRTAILCAKIQDAIDILGKPKETNGAVIMGPAHTYEGDKLLKNRKARLQTIRRFAIKALSASDRIFDEYGFGAEYKEAARKSILDYLTLATIVRVPNIDRKSIEEQTKLIKTFVSPQIEEAIKGLG